MNKYINNANIILEDKINKIKNQISSLEKEIAFSTVDYPIEVLLKLFQNGEIFINNYYQRNFIWDKKLKCTFIESFFIGFPIPFMFYSDNDDGIFDIILDFQPLRAKTSDNSSS